MQLAQLTILVLLIAIPVLPQEKEQGPKNEKAQKTYKQALEDLQQRRQREALGEFKKADKQDDGHCLACQKMLVKYGAEFGEWKLAEFAADEMVAQAQGEQDQALAHYQYAAVLFQEGLDKHKDEIFSRSHEQLLKALGIHSNFPDAIWLDGRVLAYLHQDDGARKRFEQYVQTPTADDASRQRALRFMQRPELARARMAPAFAVTAMDGSSLSMDNLQGKVVLIDFWATWCEPCREAMPHVREIARKFQGQPLVVLSVNLDSDETKWKEYVSKNQMTWTQYWDGGFDGQLATLFGVRAIPHTFTIDADGLLQDEHVGDAAMEDKLKKLIAQARQVQGGEAPAK